MPQEVVPTDSLGDNNINQQSKQPNATGALRASATRSIVSSHNHKAVPAMSLGTKPTLIEADRMRFLVMDAPRQANLPQYIREMRRHHVTDVVRVCEATYAAPELAQAGIRLHELEYRDGTSPPREHILAWLALVDETFYHPPKPAAAGASPTAAAPAEREGAAAVDGAADAAGTDGGGNHPACIAVHCVAGLGRAPVMVAIALIEFAGMDPVEAVSFLRKKRRGAINEKQLLYLEGYKKQYRHQSQHAGACCAIL